MSTIIILFSTLQLLLVLLDAQAMYTPVLPYITRPYGAATNVDCVPSQLRATAEARSAFSRISLPEQHHSWAASLRGAQGWGVSRHFLQFALHTADGLPLIVISPQCVCYFRGGRQCRLVRFQYLSHKNEFIHTLSIIVHRCRFVALLSEHS